MFSLIGTTFGGNGTTTFNLPDFRGRLSLGYDPGVSVNTIGEFSGVENATILISNLPAHTHTATFVGIGGSMMVMLLTL